MKVKKAIDSTRPLAITHAGSGNLGQFQKERAGPGIRPVMSICV